MGTFVELFASKGSCVLEEKKEVFAKRVEHLFQMGGMMEIEKVCLYGIEVFMLRKAKMRDGRISFNYNYFEEDFWENAGFDAKSCRVRSGKVGWQQFCRVVSAAYVLQEQYTEGVSVAMIDGEPIVSWGYVGWINYLFKETYHIKNLDPWKLFETMHYEEYDGRELDVHNFDVGNSGYSVIGQCEICAVLNGTEKALEMFSNQEEGTVEEIAINAMKNILNYLNLYEDFRVRKKIDRERGLRDLMNVLHMREEEKKPEGDEIQNTIIKGLVECLKICDASAFIVKRVSEIYDKNFWELWDELRDISERRQKKVYGKEGYSVVPISTLDFLWQSPDDMIYYWNERGDFNFTEELWRWFDTLKNRYESIVNLDFSVENSLYFILNLMKEAENEYLYIFTFADFFEETVENINDKRYLALWKLYDELIHDPELKKAGNVIFVQENMEKEEGRVYCWDEWHQKRLIRTWDIMPLDKKNNKARVTLRRYMAFMANKELRHKILGF